MSTSSTPSPAAATILQRANTENQPISASMTAPTSGPTSPEIPELAGSAREIGRADPTRYGDWELNGKCVDF